MNKVGYYTHTNKERYRCDVIEDTATMIRIRLSEETAKQLRLAQELWLPRAYVKTEQPGSESRAR